MLIATIGVMFTKSDDGGAEWDNGTYAYGGDKQWMRIDRTDGIGNGNIYAFWNPSYSSCEPGSFTRSTDEGASYEDCDEVLGDLVWVHWQLDLMENFIQLEHIVGQI